MEPIAEVREHPNADRMEIAVVKGWEVCTRKGEFKAGDHALFVPVDALIPEKLAETWGVASYLGRNGRVHAAKLRGVASFGFLVHENNVPEHPKSGNNYAEVLGITKHEPPPEVVNGDCAPNHPLFPMYTEIENIKNFPDAFQPGEMVIATEKIHGRCVAKDTKVMLCNGEERQISELEKGDLVLSFNEQKGNFEPAVVEDTINSGIGGNWLALTFDTSGRTIKFTYYHPFLTKNRGWVKAIYLNQNDDIVEP